VRKEVVVFLVTLAVLAAFWFLSGADPASAPTRGGRGPTRAADPQGAVAAKSTPGRFIPETEVTWAGGASNIFETPTETRDLAPLDLAPPPFPRLPHPGPPLLFPIGANARASLRRVIVPAAVAPSEGANGPGSAPPPDQPPGGTATQPTPGGSEPLIPLGGKLSAVDRIKLSLEQEEKRHLDEVRARQSEEERRRGLDKLTFTNGDVWYGEMAARKDENRYATKREHDRIRTDPGLTEPDRNEKLKKLTLLFKEDKRGKLGKAGAHQGDVVASITFADTPENRYRMRLLDVPPKDLAPQMELAKMLLDARDPRLVPIAVEHLLNMRKNGLSSPDMLAALADAQHQLYQYNQELEVLRQGVKEFPDSAPLLARLGRLQVRLGMIENARVSFTQALAKNPSDALANAGMGDVLMRSGDAARAIQHLKEALNLAGSDPVKVDAVRLLLAEAYLRGGEFKNAHDTVDLVLGRTGASGPERARISERAFGLAAIAALGQGQLVEARTRAEQGAKNHPLSGQLSYILGIIMAHQGETEPARARLAAAIDLDPLLTGHAQVALAIIEEAAGRDNAAVASAEAGALTANPTAAELRLGFGRTLLHVGDLARAREHLLAALDHEPRSADVLAALGDAAYAEGILPDAIRFYDRAAANEAGFPQLLARRIITQVRRRKLAEAEELAAQVTTADQKDPFVQAALAYFQYSKGNHAEALNALQRLGESGAGVLADYGKSAHTAVTAHQNKEMWTDTFSRQGALGRQWKREIGAGINIALTGSQAVTFDGTQRGAGVVSNKPTMIWQERPGDRVHGFSVDLDVQPQPGAYVGAGIMVFNQGKAGDKWDGMPERDGGLVPYTGMQVALNPDGKLVYRVLVKTKMSEWQPVPVTTYGGGPVTIELRLADPREGVVEVLVNRESVLKQTIADLKRFRRTLDLQVFCYAQIDRKVHFTADNVVVVTLKEAR
jgi:tetratricopeptide (TPR) repeat protein